MPGASSSNAIGVRVQEVDGSPAGFANTLTLPNGTLGLSGGVATYTPATTKLYLAGSVVSPGISSTQAVGVIGTGLSAFAASGYPLNNQAAPATGTITKFIYKLNAAQGATGTTLDIIINNSAAGLTVTLVALDPALTTYTATGSVAVTQGDLLAIDNTGAATAIHGTWVIEVTPS